MVKQLLTLMPVAMSTKTNMPHLIVFKVLWYFVKLNGGGGGTGSGVHGSAFYLRKELPTFIHSVFSLLERQDKLFSLQFLGLLHSRFIPARRENDVDVLIDFFNGVGVL